MIGRCQGSVSCIRPCFHSDPKVLLGGVTLLGVWHVPKPTAYLSFAKFLFIVLSGEPLRMGMWWVQLGCAAQPRSDRLMLILEKHRVEREGCWQSAGAWMGCLHNLNSQ